MFEMSVGDCFSFIQNGANIKQGEVDGGYPITRIETISNNRFNRDRMGYAGITDITPYGTYVLEDGDILMSHINSVRYLGRAVKYSKHDDETIIHGMNLLRLKAIREIVIPDYACLYFSSRHFREQISRITKKSVNQASFSVADLKRAKMLIASLEEQKQIVALMSRIDGIMQTRKAEYKALDQLIKARFVEMFGDPETNSYQWPEAYIGDHCFVTKLAGFEYTEYIHYSDRGEVVMVKAQNVKNGTLNQKDLSFISKEVSDSLPRSQLAPGDIVMTYVGANIGDVAIIDEKHLYHLAPNVAKIRPDSSVYNPVCFMYMLMMKTDYIVRNSADTAKAALGMERIRKLRVFTPPLELQKQFAAFVSQVDKSKAVIQSALDRAQALFDSLMQQYFG